MAVADSIDRDLTKIAALTFGDEDFAARWSLAAVASLNGVRCTPRRVAAVTHRSPASRARVRERAEGLSRVERISDLRAPPPPT
jgi:hypothetical protein